MFALWATWQLAAVYTFTVNTTSLESTCFVNAALAEGCLDSQDADVINVTVQQTTRLTCTSSTARDELNLTRWIVNESAIECVAACTAVCDVGCTQYHSAYKSIFHVVDPIDDLSTLSSCALLHGADVHEGAPPGLTARRRLDASSLLLRPIEQQLCAAVPFCDGSVLTTLFDSSTFPWLVVAAGGALLAGVAVAQNRRTTQNCVRLLRALRGTAPAPKNEFTATDGFALDERDFAVRPARDAPRHPALGGERRVTELATAPRTSAN